jgi:solute carrier family 8 (sodium/calcium exchanger)
MGVFITTAIFSVFAYIWMYYCLSINSEGVIDTLEAYLTFGYFFILLILAFSADKFNQNKKKKLEKHEEERLK